MWWGLFLKNIPNNWPIWVDGSNKLWGIWGISSCKESTKKFDLSWLISFQSQLKANGEDSCPVEISAHILSLCVPNPWFSITIQVTVFEKLLILIKIVSLCRSRLWLNSSSVTLNSLWTRVKPWKHVEHVS